MLSMVAGIVATVGSFRCKGEGESEAAMVMIQHPGCLMVEPSGSMTNLQSVASTVKMKPGLNHFEFDCEGREVEADYEATGKEHWLTFDPAKGFMKGSVKNLPTKTADLDLY